MAVKKHTMAPPLSADIASSVLSEMEAMKQARMPDNREIRVRRMICDAMTSIRKEIQNPSVGVTLPDLMDKLCATIIQHNAMLIDELSRQDYEMTERLTTIRSAADQAAKIAHTIHKAASVPMENRAEMDSSLEAAYRRIVQGKA